jgi:hypothetical protein
LGEINGRGDDCWGYARVQWRRITRVERGNVNTPEKTWCSGPETLTNQQRIFIVPHNKNDERVIRVILIGFVLFWILCNLGQTHRNSIELLSTGQYIHLPCGQRQMQPKGERKFQQ